jgi:transcriptional regulator with XRE-family HTH domain
MASTIPIHPADFPSMAYDLGAMAGRPSTKSAPEFGQRLADARKLRRLTQQQLARSIGVSQKMIDYYERRAVNIKSETIRKLALALEVGVDELMGTKPPKAKPGPKSRLMRQFEQVEQLPVSDQELVSRLINRFLKKAA